MQKQKYYLHKTKLTNTPSSNCNKIKPQLSRDWRRKIEMKLPSHAGTHFRIFPGKNPAQPICEGKIHKSNKRG